MKQKLSIVTAFLIIGAFLFVCTSSAIPPMPSSSGTTYDGTGVNITATTANITTLTAANAVFTASNTTGVMAANVIDTTGSIYINDTANAKNTLGLTINHGANDDESLTLKNSDIAHGMTDITETDTYAFLQKRYAGYGGLYITGLSDDAFPGLVLRGISGGAPAYNNVVEIVGAKKSSTYTSVLAANEIIFGVVNFTTTLMTILGDGKVNFWKLADNGTNKEGLQIDPATAGDMKITAVTGGTGTDDINITLTPTGTGKVRMPNHSVRSTTGGGLVRKYYEALSGAMSSGTVTITMGIPANARLLGLQLKVKDLITSGDGGTTWTAAFAGGSTDAIGSGYAFTANTVANVLIPSNVTTAGTNIVITPNSGTFSAGNVLGIVYVEELDSI